jgi:sortase A
VRDRRSVDDLTIEELERILAIRKRQARLERLRRYGKVGRRVEDVPPPEPDDLIEAPPAEAEAAPPDQEEPADSAPPVEGEPKTRPLRDRLLLALEVVAVLGLVAILIGAARALQNLNREAQAAFQRELELLPSPSPTPLISAVVLPGGHTPPTEQGGAQPNYDEVPEHLRPLVEEQFSGPAIAPTPAPGSAIRLRIPAIGVDAPVVEGDGWEQLKKGVAHRLGTADPGQRGNMVFSAHNDIFGEIFRDLDQLEVGDSIYAHTQLEAYTYRVAAVRIVEPTAVELMESTHEPTVTLVSCYPYLVDDERSVVIAELVEE